MDLEVDTMGIVLHSPTLQTPDTVKLSSALREITPTTPINGMDISKASSEELPRDLEVALEDEGDRIGPAEEWVPWLPNRPAKPSPLAIISPVPPFYLLHPFGLSNTSRATPDHVVR